MKDHIILKRVNPEQWDGIYHKNWELDRRAGLMSKEDADAYVADENKDPKRLDDRIAVKVDIPV